MTISHLFLKVTYTFLRRKLDVPTDKGGERGEVDLTVDGLVQLSKLYNVSTAYLLGLTAFPDRIKHKIK